MLDYFSSDLLITEPQGFNGFHVSILARYFSNLSMICDFPELPSPHLVSIHYPRYWDPHTVASFKQKLEVMFMVPKLNDFQLTQNRINKFHLLQAFLSLLLQLLYHKIHLIVHPFEDGIGNLEKELRFLLTILGDISWMLSDSQEHDARFQNLLPEFEAVANQAGSFVRYLVFSDDQTFEQTDDGLVAVLKHIDLLKTNLRSSVSISVPAAYASPTTSVVDSILILRSLVDDLEDLFKREDDPLADVKDQVKHLHHELLLSHSSIKDMKSPQPSEIEEVKEDLMRIGGIAHQVEYLITSFLVKDAPLWYVINRLTHLGHSIEPIRMELQLVTKKYQFGGLKVADHFSAKMPLHDKRNTEANDVIVGFEEKTRDILDQLVGGSGSESRQVILILGMPGLGKTTLAKKLYNHPSVRYRFDKHSWCVVSQTYNKQKILANILIHINGELREDSIFNMDEINLIQHIHQTLMGRRYLIVLDDIWESNVLDELVRRFPDDENGSRILLTSRNKDVVPPNSMIHELPFLSDEQCWKLLQMKAFGSRTYPPELQKIGEKIAARCYGLPLTVVVIAGVLSTMDEKESTWEEVRGSLGSYINGEDNSVMQILELSYWHLPDHLKSCFLYFGEFEEDEEISVGNMKRLWIAEGFIRKEKDKSAENTAEEYLMQLIDRSLVMIAKSRNDGKGAKSCVVHDLLRDLCLKKSIEESFLKYWKSDYLHNIYEKGHRIRAFGETATLSYCQHVRSYVGDRQSSSFYVRDMRLLRVLHFKNIYSLLHSRFPDQMFGIEYLVNLRFLVIDDLPKWINIDTLVNLEYIRLKLQEGAVFLPLSIVKLKKLRYIWARSAEYSEDWNVSYQTDNLECLSGITIKKLGDEELLKCSPNLRKLKCTYDTYFTMGKSAYPHYDLCFLTRLAHSP